MASKFSLAAFVRDESLTIGTSEGEIDLLQRVDGLGAFHEVNEQSIKIETADGLEVRMLTLDGPIAAKRASNREKDRLDIVELEALAEMLRIRNESAK